MNWTKLAAAGFFALLNVAAVSAHADTRLDVKKVISTVEQGGSHCGIVNARMTYLDSHGVQKVLDYSKFGECANQGS